MRGLVQYTMSEVQPNMVNGGDPVLRLMCFSPLQSQAHDGRSGFDVRSQTYPTCVTQRSSLHPGHNPNHPTITSRNRHVRQQDNSRKFKIGCITSSPALTPTPSTNSTISVPSTLRAPECATWPSLPIPIASFKSTLESALESTSDVNAITFTSHTSSP
jgi:hypothetical protein